MKFFSNSINKKYKYIQKCCSVFNRQKIKHEILFRELNLTIKAVGYHNLDKRFKVTKTIAIIV